MMTRFHLAPAYAAGNPVRKHYNGFVKIDEIEHVTHTWAVARPMSSWQANGAPFYLAVPAINRPIGNQLIRTGTARLLMPAPRIEMDPSDSTTWQRQYKFQ